MIQMCYAFRDDDEVPKEVFVHHAAGLTCRGPGRGSADSSSINSVIPKVEFKPDRDVKNGWTGLSEGTREERLYYCQNWRADVSAILTDTGTMVEWVKYSAYGVPYSLPAGDTDSDGDWDATDDSAISGSGSYDVRQDADLNGKVESDDITHANSITGGYQTLGRWLLGADIIGNRRGYAGYEFDPTFVGNKRSLYHVRNRVYDAGLGRWTRRDPLGYADGMGLYTYVGTQPMSLLDYSGRCGTTCNLSRQTPSTLLQPTTHPDDYVPSPCIPEDTNPDIAIPDAIMPRCDVVDNCIGDPWVQAALQLVQASCVAGGRCAYWFIICDDTTKKAPGGPPEGETYPNICLTRIRRGPGFTEPCIFLAHELVHIADSCAAGDNIYNDQVSFCEHEACTEARGNHVSCCGLAQRVNPRRLVPYDFCMSSQLTLYLNTSPCAALLG